jgi:hypothetical protein
LAQDRNEKWAHVDTLMNVWVENFLACWATICFSRRSLLHEVCYFQLQMTV